MPGPKPFDVTRAPSTGATGSVGPTGPTGSGVAAPATDGQQPIARGSAWHLVGATVGTDLADAAATINVSAGAVRFLPLLSASRIGTFGNTGVDSTYGGDLVEIVREDANAFTYTVKNIAGVVIYVFPVSVKRAALFRYDINLADYEYLDSIAITNS